MIEKELTPDAIADILADGPLDDLLRLPIVLSLDARDDIDVETLCLDLTTHGNRYVRGNAMLAFGHIARTLRRLDAARVKPVLEAALHDEDSYVRGQADAAISDIRHFLGWKFRD